MRPAILCLERLDRIRDVLDRVGGSLSVRDFTRTFRVYPWELKQAAELGQITLELRKPHTGRPSLWALKASDCEVAKLPPRRNEIPNRISFRHWNFARECPIRWANRKFGSMGRFFRGGVKCLADAYQIAFRHAKSRRGAAASASRLARHPDVRAALAWYFAKVGQRIGMDEPEPVTAAEVWERLRHAPPR